MKFNEDEKRLLVETSLERVLNNALWIASKGVKSPNEQLSENCGQLIDDLDILGIKSLASKLWNAAREEYLKSSVKL